MKGDIMKLNLSKEIKVIGYYWIKTKTRKD